jgi:hypothetical protein
LPSFSTPTCPAMKTNSEAVRNPYSAALKVMDSGLARCARAPK